MTIEQLTSDKCCGCAACVEKCPVKAITMKYDNNFDRVPVVDTKTCISCGQCVKICPRFNDTCNQIDINTVYLGSYKNKELEKKSSSGGLFAALAHYFFNQGGIVYGAAMVYENKRLQCRHIRVENVEDIHLLQGSKYIQSRTDGIFGKVKKDLKDGKIVLFSGTSCQVASIKRFIGENKNLYTVDLVCHGVPKDILFNDYIDYYEKKHNCIVKDISFRAKGIYWHGKEMKHVLTLKIEKNATIYHDVLIEPQSSYYCLFMERAGYRKSCYNCIYAKVDKPSDITLGDYTLTTKENNDYNLPLNHTYSTIITHNERGQQLLREIKPDLLLSEVSSSEVIARHGNLNHPSVITADGKILYDAYLTGGFLKVQSIVNYWYFKSRIKWLLTSWLK